MARTGEEKKAAAAPKGILARYPTTAATGPIGLKSPPRRPQRRLMLLGPAKSLDRIDKGDRCSANDGCGGPVRAVQHVYVLPTRSFIAMECLLGGIYVLHCRDEKPGERKTMKGRQPPSREVDSQAVHLRYIHILVHTR